jgi:hypothetical protein
MVFFFTVFFSGFPGHQTEKKPICLITDALPPRLLNWLPSSRIDHAPDFWKRLAELHTESSVPQVKERVH